MVGGWQYYPWKLDNFKILGSNSLDGPSNLGLSSRFSSRDIQCPTPVPKLSVTFLGAGFVLFV